MAKRTLHVGATSHREFVRIFDQNGSPITGLVYNSTGLAAKYFLSGAAGVAITLITQTVAGAYSSGGFIEIDATAAPGLYRLDVPDAAFASGAKSIVTMYGYSGMSVVVMEYDLFALDPYDAVRAGLTALPNANAGANGGLPLSVDASGRVDVLKINGTSQTARDIGASVLVGDKTGFSLTSAYDPAKTAAQAGDAMTLTSGERTSIGTAVWASATRTLSSFGTLVSDIWAAVADSAGVTTLLSRLTSGRATNLDNLDAAISTRSTYAGADTSGTTTLLGRLTGTRATNLDNLDAAISTRLATAGYTAPDNADIVLIKAKTDNLPASPAAVGSAMTLTAAYDAAKTAAQAGDAMTLTSGERTSIGTAVWASATRTLSSFGTLVADIWAAVADSAGVTTLLSRLTSGRATNLDNLDAAISTRSTYAGADTSGTTSLLARLTSTRAGNLDFLDVSLTSGFNAVLSAISGIVAGVWAAGTRTLTSFGFSVTAATVSDKTGYSLTAAYDAAKTAAQAGSAMTLTSGERNSIASALLLLADGVEPGFTMRDSMRLQLAALAGKLSGAPGGPILIRDVNDTVDRIAATVDADGNRTAVTLDAA